MLKMKSKKLKNKIFRDIKKLYEKEVVTYNVIIEGLDRYMIVHLNIMTMLSSLKVTRNEIRKCIGLEFDTWFFETHDIIVEGFLEKKL